MSEALEQTRPKTSGPSASFDTSLSIKLGTAQNAARPKTGSVTPRYDIIMDILGYLHT